MTKHLIIPDVQAAPGSDLRMCSWAGQYCVDQYAGEDIKIIMLGDVFDMPSLSSYDEGKRSMEGRRVKADLEAGQEAFDRFNTPFIKYNDTRRRFKERTWNPEKHYLLGNHENRVARALELEPKFDGLISMESFEQPGWQMHDFLDIAWLDGIAYSHYFCNPMTGMPLSGMMDTRLKNLGHSFIQGHIPGRQFAVRRLASPEGPRELMGMVLGSFYLPGPHIDYQGTQGSAYWNGIVVLHEAENGTGDPMFVSIDYLRRRYA